jgi:uncharacterized repeat protein (TIGR03803 family)
MRHQHYGSEIFGRVAAFAVLALLFIALNARAQTFAVLHSFTGGSADGQFPYDGLVRDKKGNLYGTTYQGGSANSFGTVFKLDQNNVESILYAFKAGADGAYPYGGLIRDKVGNLYGTTAYGGKGARGTIFQLTGRGHEVVLYSFQSASGDGIVPLAGLVADIAGNLYGTTSQGGPKNGGTAFKLRRKMLKEVVLHNFVGGTDGLVPYFGTLLRDASGALYGTTLLGGSSNGGTVFKLDRNNVETILHAFTGGAGDGANPEGGLLRGRAGNLYGTTFAGGTFNSGTVFKIDSTGKESLLYSFGAVHGDGSGPQAAVLQDAKGNLYGTTQSGGSYNYGTVFKLDSAGHETVLHSFNPASEGIEPSGPLVSDGKGHFYGTTVYGGTSGFGTVFKLTP